jgi:hypothetical protein
MRIGSHTHARLLLLLTLVLFLLLLLPNLACGGSPVLFSGIEGETRIGPTSPLGTPGSSDTKPYSTGLRVKRLPDGKIVAEFTSDSEGRFRAVLPPGNYVVEPMQSGPLPMGSSVDVTVTAGQFAHVQIDFESGIR